MLTNIQIGAGGAYAIITRSLGPEMGGAIGIPLYISQTISIAFYITGFSELWIFFFPTHSIVVVGVLTWAVLSGISLISAKLAFQLQYGILAAVVEKDDMKKQTINEMVTFIDEARLPANTKVRVYTGEFKELLVEHTADLNILGMPFMYAVMMDIINSSPSSLFFAASGGLENALI